jgi:acyl-CoA thioesterase FadM
MQDIAVQHYTHLGGLSPTQAIGATWSYVHQIEYLRPAYLDDQIEGRTVANLRRVRSSRRYEFVRKSDGATSSAAPPTGSSSTPKAATCAPSTQYRPFFTLLPDPK